MRTTKFDASDYIDTPARVAGYLASAFEDGDVDDIRDAIAVVARSRGMAKIAKTAKLNEKALYRTLGKTGNPEFATVMRLRRALGITLTVKPPRQPANWSARIPPSSDRWPKEALRTIARKKTV